VSALVHGRSRGTRTPRRAIYDLPTPTLKFSSRKFGRPRGLEIFRWNSREARSLVGWLRGWHHFRDARRYTRRPRREAGKPRRHRAAILSNRVQSRPPFASNIDPPCAGRNPPGARQCDNQDENAPPLSLRSEGVARPRERQRRRAEKFLPLQWRGAGCAVCGNWRKV